jgi:putative transposase
MVLNKHMPYRIIPFINGEIYHIYNRGVAKLPIFSEKRDYRRLLDTLHYYKHQDPKPQFSQIKRFKDFEIEVNPKIVEILCYCLMPNHYHILIRQLENNGIPEFISKITNSYTKFFNIKYERVGPLLQGQFKAVRIEATEQLMHVSRYIHLNPTTSFLVKDLENYEWSSYLNYIGLKEDNVCEKDFISSLFKSPEEYKQFVLDQKDYAQKLHLIKHLSFE